MTESGKRPWTSRLETVAGSLGGVRAKAHFAGLSGLPAAVPAACPAYGTPLDQTLSGGSRDAVFGLFPSRGSPSTLCGSTG